ncbi:MAG TPA: family 20 glycosylhydrolase [Candidatus Sulfotelmatobacter sp.]|nr:family 20 glycosylhydrolase [Candidatus Sulfotelmatobacter sp.]
MKSISAWLTGRTCSLITALAILLLTFQTALAGPPAKGDWFKTWQATNPLWRGVHLSAQSDQQVAELIETLPRLVAIGVNVLIVEVNYSFEFQSHPELRAEQFVSRERAHALVQAAHARGIRVIPELNCLGHQSWAKHTLPLLVKYPQFDETPGHFSENKDIYCRSWCPQNPKLNKIVFALMDELIEGFEADAFHVGMDEVFLIGSAYCPRCRGEDPARLFAKAVTDFHAHLVDKRQVEMLLWGDRLLDAKELGYSEWEAAKNGTQAALELIPKDVIVCDWHYGKRDTYPSVPLLLEKGFRVWPSGWQPLEANQAFSAFARQQKHPRLLGYLCTTWGKVKIPDMPEWPPVTEVLKEWKVKE